MMPLSADQSIGVFDSGVGGLTILGDLWRKMPSEDFVYLGDTARLPYGNKSSSAIIRYSLECAQFLLKQNIKLLVVACHTASSQALWVLQKELPIPVIGVVRPGFELLMQTTRLRRMAILATSSTIASNVYQDLISSYDPSCVVFPVACPLFVPLAEENLFDHAATDAIAHHYLDRLQDNNIDVALLACTHYPLLRSAIERALPPSVLVLEPGSRCAEQVFNELASRHLLQSEVHRGTSRFFATDHISRFSRLAHTFLGQPIELSLADLEKNES